MSARKRPDDIPTATERKSGVDRRKVKNILRKQFWGPDAAEYSFDQLEFMKACDDYKRERGRPFPTWAEVLAIALALGYRKVAENTLSELLKPSKPVKRPAESDPPPSVRK